MGFGLVTACCPHAICKTRTTPESQSASARFGARPRSSRNPTEVKWEFLLGHYETRRDSRLGCPSSNARQLSCAAYRHQLKTRRPLIHYSKRALQGNASAAQRSLLEETSDQGHAMRHPSRRRKSGQGILWIRRPIAAGLRDFDKTRSQCKRR